VRKWKKWILGLELDQMSKKKSIFGPIEIVKKKVKVKKSVQA
jgi:hypothetical protein